MLGWSVCVILLLLIGFWVVGLFSAIGWLVWLGYAFCFGDLLVDFFAFTWVCDVRVFSL